MVARPYKNDKRGNKAMVEKRDELAEAMWTQWCKYKRISKDGC
jgi:hypothetical protein